MSGEPITIEASMCQQSDWPFLYLSVKIRAERGSLCGGRSEVSRLSIGGGG